MTCLSCQVDAIPAEERAAHGARIKRLFGSASLERVDLPDGYRFRFAVDELGEIAQFISVERVCCPFLHFVMEVNGNHDSLTLLITGPPGAKAVVGAELLPAR
jgi:hypothetical protein